MGKVTEHLKAQIEKQIENKGIVVWYDPEKAYVKMVQSLDIEGIPVLRFEDSFLRLRKKAEQYLEFIKPDGKPRHDCSVPPRLLVYVPLDRRDTHHALVELETAGVIMEPGVHSLPLNTRLRLVGEQVFKTISPDSLEDIAQQIEAGLLNLEDLDRIAEEAGALSTAVIKLIFKTNAATEVALEFAAVDHHDDELNSKKAMPELMGLFRSELGIDLDAGKSPKEARQEFRRILLLTDLIGSLQGKETPAALTSVQIPQKQTHVDKVTNICKVWRNRADYVEPYEQASLGVEQEAGLANVDLNLDTLGSVETFPFVEQLLLLQAEKCILDGKPDKARELTVKRRNSFWSLRDHTNQLRWALLDDAAQILNFCSSITQDLKTVEKCPPAMVKIYVEHDSPWYILDTHYRHLETKYSTFELELGREHRTLEQVIALIRQKYSQTVERCIEAFTDALRNADFQIGGYLPQGKIFQKYGLTGTGNVEKTAYVLVDALRYEMGRELLDGLSEEFEVTIEVSIAQLPSITPVGMAALMPGVEKGLELVEMPGGKIAITVGSETLKDRASRLKYFCQAVGNDATVLKLNELMKPSAETKKKIKGSSLILVTSQEIDRWGEEGEEDEARIFMEQVLERLRTGIRNLGRLGATRLIVTADHGHLFGETIASGMKMDQPGGKTVELHRRVWIGKGGTTGEGYLRVKASQLGLGGDLEFAFPKSLSCFKAGGSAAYFHGGISLQELVIPVILLKTKMVCKKPSGDTRIDLKMAKPTITNRFFSVTALFTWDGMFGTKTVRVKVEIKAGRKEVGFAAMAAYGFEDKEIVLEIDKENPITLMLSQTDVEKVSISLLDAVSQVEIARLDNIPVNITI